mgnify:CR=1 FL=1
MEILQGLLDNLTALLAAHPLAGVNPPMRF